MKLGNKIEVQDEYGIWITGYIFINASKGYAICKHELTGIYRNFYRFRPDFSHVKAEVWRKENLNIQGTVTGRFHA